MSPITSLIICILTINLANTSSSDSNAATIYYKLWHLVPYSGDVWNQIRDLPTSESPISNEVKECIEGEKTKYIIEELGTASQLEQCDWGIDFSQGFETTLPHLSKMLAFEELILADGAIAVNQGDISTAINRNLIARRMANHLSDDCLIIYRVAHRMTKESNEALYHILQTRPIDTTTLIELKNQLLQEIYRPKSIYYPLKTEKKICFIELSKLERSATYTDRYFDKIFILLKKPYSQAYVGIASAYENAVHDAEKNNDAVLIVDFFQRLEKFYNSAVQWQTEYDAMLTALDVYITAAKTGKLPEKLPESTYIDHFSGKPFIYEITEDGFTLKCQQEDLDKKEVHEFHYKLPR